MRTKPIDRKKHPLEKIALSRRHTADVVDRSEGWLRLRELHGDGPPFVRCGRAILYPLDSLREWITRNASPGGPSAA